MPCEEAANRLRFRVGQKGAGGDRVLGRGDAARDHLSSDERLLRFGEFLVERVRVLAG